jgi:hypothetical protein
MPGPSDLLKAWHGAIREIGGVAVSLAFAPVGKAGELLEPMQRQAQRVLERPLEFERDLVTRAIAPARATLEMAEQAAIAYRAQAGALRAAASSLGQLAELMEQQAELIEQMGTAVRDPLSVLRAANAQLWGGGDGDAGDD